MEGFYATNQQARAKQATDQPSPTLAASIVRNGVRLGIASGVTLAASMLLPLYTFDFEGTEYYHGITKSAFGFEIPLGLAILALGITAAVLTHLRKAAAVPFLYLGAALLFIAITITAFGSIGSDAYLNSGWGNDEIAGVTLGVGWFLTLLAMLVGVLASMKLRSQDGAK